ncbi:hypothetical protein LSH36_73g00011 [Paralvinella palmiformis]|uniref:Uncharacterized protein n=1 Tax=Paralvinella palmiformis TaxID=53620 RepID=A0AAD9K2Q3_9ANNE|nr:hypothetical protein LSH36_73g00011 [Paralvinella palmiformis]
METQNWWQEGAGFFEKRYCPFRKKAKKVLEESIKNGELRREDYEAIDIKDDPDMEVIQKELKRMTTHHCMYYD